MTICLQSQCLTKNASTDKFCQKCGKKLLLVERYRAIKKIGEGGFGRTFKAIDELKPSQPLCVIKQFAPQAQGTNNLEKAAELFAQEAARLDELGKHPQIPKLFAYFSQDNEQYLVQEFIDGENLLEELQSKGNFKEADIRQLLIEILSVLKFVHGNKVIHRDIKPENIIRRNSNGKLVLVDFGASKVVTNPNLSVTGTVIGSAQYASPEQAAGKPRYASDLYSLGVTCLHLLTGIEPFDLYSYSEADWVWRDFLVDNPVSDELGQILDKLVESAIKRRYKSVDEVLPLLTPTTTFKYYTDSPPVSIKQNSSSQSTQIQISNSIPPLKTFEFKTTKIIKIEYALFGRNQTQTEGISSTAQYFRENLDNGVDLDMVLIPSGEFMMGSNEYAKEKPIHQVSIKPFFMAKYPITQAQWKAIALREDLKVKRDLKPNPSHFQGKNNPVEKVSWLDAIEFCQRLSRLSKKEYKLPSESQWEYACRAETSTPFYFGKTITTDLANYNGKYIYNREAKGIYRDKTTFVGKFPANSFGLYDLHGNVWEWCEDNWHSDYQNSPDDGSTWLGKNDNYPVVRGGSWYNSPKDCRSTNRVFYNSKVGFTFNIGFRCVCCFEKVI